MDLLMRHPPLPATIAARLCHSRLRDSALYAYIPREASAYSAGTVLVLPGIHQARPYSTRDQVYRPIESASATGAAPFQSNEGLSIGVDLTVRWAIDRTRIAQLSKEFPDDLNADLIR